jgi:hypothetical protein
LADQEAFTAFCAGFTEEINSAAARPSMADAYRQKVETLAASLEHTSEEARESARSTLRGFIDTIVIPPDGLLEVHGDLGRMLAARRWRAPRCGARVCC